MLIKQQIKRMPAITVSKLEADTDTSYIVNIDDGYSKYAYSDVAALINKNIPHVETLVINRCIINDSDNLPESLTTLCINSGSMLESTDMMPGNLIHLEIRNTFLGGKAFSGYSNWHYLPFQLKYLNIFHYSISAKSLDYLPLNLATLLLQHCNSIMIPQDNGLSFINIVGRISQYMTPKNKSHRKFMATFIAHHNLHRKTSIKSVQAFHSLIFKKRKHGARSSCRRDKRGRCLPTKFAPILDNCVLVDIAW
jgi:hypothetical protein